MDRIATLGRADDPAGFAPNVEVARSPDGRFYVSSATFNGQIWVYDSSGQLEARIGREGEAPGEYRGQLILRFRADTLVVLGFSPPRLTLLDPAGSVARLVTLRGRAFDVAARSRDFVLVETAPDAETIRLKLLSNDGADERVLDSGLALDQRSGAWYRHSLAVTPGDTVVALARNEYALAAFDGVGNVVQQLRGERDWPSGPVRSGRRDLRTERAALQMTGVQTAGGVHLRVWAATADRAWRARRPDEDYTASDVYDTVVEVIDLRTGELVARSWFDDLILPIGNSHAQTVRETPEGDRRIDVFEVTFTR
ncbi:MAG: hypothetical protein WEA24_12810 [Gemmatimonadota bacterium]